MLCLLSKWTPQMNKKHFPLKQIRLSRSVGVLEGCVEAAHLLVLVQRVDDQLHHPVHLRLEGVLL